MDSFDTNNLMLLSHCAEGVSIEMEMNEQLSSINLVSSVSNDDLNAILNEQKIEVVDNTNIPDGNNVFLDLDEIPNTNVQNVPKDQLIFTEEEISFHKSFQDAVENALA